MLRRDFLMKAGAAGAAGAAATTLAAPAISQGRMQLRMTTSWPKRFPQVWVPAHSRSLT